MGKFDEIAPDVLKAPALSDSHMKEFVQTLASPSEGTRYNPVIIDAALSGFHVDMKIVDAVARITLYCPNFSKRLDSVGCRSFREDKPKKSIEILRHRLQPVALKKEMRRRLEYDVSLQNDSKKFIKTLTREAVNCQTYSIETTDTTNRSLANSGKKTYAQESRGAEGAPLKKLPLCLFPAHRAKGYRHFMKDCKACSRDVQDRLLAQHECDRNAYSKRTQGAVQDKSGVIFAASFGDKMRTTICADICADANIIGNNMITKFKKAGIGFTIEDMQTKRFEMAFLLPDGRLAFLICNKAAVIGTELHIRHGSALVLRGVRWLVTDQCVGEPFLERPPFEALGLDIRQILVAAARKPSGVVDVSNLVDDYSTTTAGRVVRILEGVFHAEGGVQDTDLSEEEDGWLDLGPESLNEKKAVLSKKLREAADSGLSPSGVKTLSNNLLEFDGVIKFSLDGRPFAVIELLKIYLKPDAVPVRTKQRRFPPPKREFMTRYIRELSKLRFVQNLTCPEWVSAPLIVPKKPPAMHRLTIDYRSINKATVLTFWAMPNIDAELSDTRGATAFAGIDFCSGYWQAPLHPESQPLFAFMTPTGVVMPTRTTQGGCKSAANFQEKVEQCFSELRENLKAWIDDFTLFAPNEEQMLWILLRFFQICRKRRLIVSLLKSDFYLKEASWCGRLINKEDAKFNPWNLSGLQNCDHPRTAGELCEIVHGVSWVSSTIPRFAERAASLRELLEAAYTMGNGSRRKKSIARFRLAELGWNRQHMEAFLDFQEQLKEATRLTHCDPNMVLCIHTDSSDRHWALAATQCMPEELNKFMQDQSHQPFAFLSGTYTDREEHWSTYEREAFAVVQAFRKLDYLAACDPSTRVFTDHRNLLFNFNPTATKPSLGRHKVLKVICWALFLSTFTYRIEHVPGDANTLPDIMTRWMRGYRKPTAIRGVAPALPFSGVTMPPDSPQFQWPFLPEIRTLQNKHKAAIPKGSVPGPSNTVRNKEAIWIPDACINLKLRLLTIAHTGESGNRGTDSTEQALCEHFYWTDQIEDVCAFIASCLLCLFERSAN